MIIINVEKGAVDTVIDDDVAVFIEKIHEFNNDEENYHPYFKRSYDLIIAKIHDYELPEDCIMLEDLDFFKGGRKILRRRDEIERIANEVTNYAKKLVDAIERLYKLVPPKTLQRIIRLK